MTTIDVRDTLAQQFVLAAWTVAFPLHLELQGKLNMAKENCSFEHII